MFRQCPRGVEMVILLYIVPVQVKECSLFCARVHGRKSVLYTDQVLLTLKLEETKVTE